MILLLKTYFLSTAGAVTPQRSSKGQHSAPRGGPPRSWTNDELTKALENVWNRRMTTSQASRVYGIPYNSLLMYVRGKYGKSLKLDKLKETTPAAKDNLNTIGNSRSTPKEKLASSGNNSGLLTPTAMNENNKPVKSKHGSGSSSGSAKSVNSSQKTPLLDSFENNPFMAAITGLSPLGGSADSSRMKDVMQQIQTRQALLDQSERLKEFEKHMGPEQAKLLMPFFANSAANQSSNISETDIEMKENNKELLEKDEPPASAIVEEDDNRNNMKPLEVNASNAEISA